MINSVNSEQESDSAVQYLPGVLCSQPPESQNKTKGKTASSYNRSLFIL